MRSDTLRVELFFSTHSSLLTIVHVRSGVDNRRKVINLESPSRDGGTNMLD